MEAHSCPQRNPGSDLPVPYCRHHRPIGDCRIGKTDAPLNRKPASTKRLGSDLGKCGWTQCGSQDFKTDAMRSGISECQTTASQSVATNIARPPSLTTRNASERARSTSWTYSATPVHTTASNEPSGFASYVASSIPYESHF